MQEIFSCIVPFFVDLKKEKQRSRRLTKGMPARMNETAKTQTGFQKEEICSKIFG